MVRTEAVLLMAACCCALLNGCANSNPLPATAPQTPYEATIVPESSAYPTPERLASAAAALSPTASPTLETPGTATAAPFPAQTPVALVTATAAAVPSPSATPFVPPVPTTSATPTPTSTLEPAAVPAATRTTLSPDEHHLADLINQERIQAGRKTLPLDLLLTTVAQERSRDMLVRNYFSHTDPVSQVPLAPALLRRYGLDVPYGENLFKSAPYQPGVTDEAMRLLMADPAHRGIILSTDWTAMGVGIAYGDAVIITQIFGVR